MGDRSGSTECLHVRLPQAAAPNGIKVPRPPYTRRVAGSVLAMALGIHATAPSAVHPPSGVSRAPQQP
eukprot:6123608-Alexandrium_andersonii.AAC.1